MGSALGRRANVFQARILHFHNLHADDAVYIITRHVSVNYNFRTVKLILAFHEHMKKGSLKRVHKDSFFQVTFCSRRRAALVALYNGKPGEKLNLLHYKHLFEKVATSTFCFHKPCPLLLLLQNITASELLPKARV